jgi:hypothetical protein
MSNIVNSKADEQIEYHKTFNTGPARLAMLLHGLKFEIETGMRLTRKAPKCTTILRKEFGITGKPVKQYYTFVALLQKHGVIEVVNQADA